MQNLDVKCAEVGRDIAGLQGVEEKLLTDALVVLEEQGVYALFLYLDVRGKEAGNSICNRCKDFLSETPEESPLLLGGNGINLWEKLQQLAEDLDRLLFARDLLRQVLIYARFHIKAKGGPGP